MSHIYKIPSKTFIMGEYLVLRGGLGLLLATGPEFCVKVKSLVHSHGSQKGFHVDSPGGRFCSLRGLDGVEFEMADPHGGQGGFGRSTAEYLSAHLYFKGGVEGCKNPISQIKKDIKSFINEYQGFVSLDSPPSGGDLLAQVYGGLCWYDSSHFKVDILSWPFSHHDILIFRTGLKSLTHEHLKDQNIESLDFEPLAQYVQRGRRALEKKDIKMFCKSINSYYDQLNYLNLSHAQVYERVLRLRENPKVLAAKGCGALGVDTVLFVVRLEDRENFKKDIKKELKNWTFVSSLSNLHGGVSGDFYEPLCV